MKIVAYLRVSTDSQVESGLGLAAQQQACEKHAAKIGSPLHSIYTDAGLSGALSIEKRPGMLNAISCLEKSDILLVAKRDRLGRDRLVLAMIESTVARKGAKIISAAGEGTENNDPASLLMSQIVDAFSVYERQIIKARISAAMQQKIFRNEFMGGLEPTYGYRIAPDGIHLEPNEEEQQMICLLKDLYKQGLSVRKIAKELNSRNLLNRGRAWNHQTVYTKIKHENV